MAGTPYYDSELRMAASYAHIETILYLGPLLRDVAQQLGYCLTSDHPTWYWISELNQQKCLYPDLAIATTTDLTALSAEDLALAVEVVTTRNARKEQKDTVRMKAYNEYHEVPEFVLIYPEPDDPRSVVWHRLDETTRTYREVALPADRRYRSTAIPGLEIEVLDRAAWRMGRKVRIYFQGELLRESVEEAAVRRRAERRAEAERQARETAQQQARSAQQEAEAERQAREAAQQEAEAERQAREAAQQEAEAERQAREAIERQMAELLARLREAGLES
jgi:flagellar biosynthesis GTPase FlhF